MREVGNAASTGHPSKWAQRQLECAAERHPWSCNFISASKWENGF